MNREVALPPFREVEHERQYRGTEGEKSTRAACEFLAFLPVALPRHVVAAHILLPYFSPGGKYVVSVTTDRNGSDAKAEGQRTANVNGFHADLSVTLDLHNLPQGTYYLATTHEGDRAWYYYPLTVR